MNYDTLHKAVSGAAAAIRIVTRLEPVGHPRDKVFPPTYAGGEYATEDRYAGINPKDSDEPLKAVLLHSVAGQANLMEEALKSAILEGRIKSGNQPINIPLLKVSFANTAAAEYISEPITVLDAPHRIFDAIFRDSEVPEENRGAAINFKDTGPGQAIAKASLANATPLYEWSPTSLVFGCWNSANDKVPGKIKGNLKFARALVSEIVGYEVVTGTKVGGRLDPLGITRQPIYEDAAGDWTPKIECAKMDGDQPVKFKVKVKSKGLPSEILHGNIAPSIGGAGDEGSSQGGVTMKYALQTTVLSLSALRRMRFPVKEEKGNGSIQSPETDAAARTVLAALGLVAIAAQRERDYFLRSRCELRATEAPSFEFVVQGRDVSAEDKFTLTFKDAVALLSAALAVTGIPKWKSEEEMPNLKPKGNLAELIRLSHERGGAADEEQDQAVGTSDR